MINLEIAIPPTGKARPRFTKRGFTYTPKTTVDAEAEVIAAWASQAGFRFEAGTPLEVSITFFYPVPKSISKKQQKLMLEGLIYPTKKPDLDNMAKLVLDALNGHAYHDDSQIIKLNLNKQYADKGYVKLQIQEFDVKLNHELLE